MLKDAAISLSLANLYYVKVWSRLLSSSGSYFNEFPIVYASIMLNVLLLAIIFFAARKLIARFGNGRVRRYAQAAFLLSLLIPLNGVLMMLSTFPPLNAAPKIGSLGYLLASVMLTAITMAVLLRFQQRIISALPKLALALLPFVLLTFSQAMWQLAGHSTVVAWAAEATETKAAPTAPAQQKTSSRRILWLVFDEFDQRVAFSERPAGVVMPEFDRLLKQSVYATNAFPPARLTYMSMPSLITGKIISKVTPVSDHELMINYGDEAQAVAWSRQPNIFADARQDGYTTGLIGWCHPYCGVIGNSLTHCQVIGEKEDNDISLKGSMYSQLQSLIATAPLIQQLAIPLVQRVAFINKLVLRQERQKYMVRYQGVMQDTLRAATDPGMDLLMIHLPIPHPPGIYNRTADAFSFEGTASYVDNLKLADRTVGEIRRAMEAAGMWDNTTVLISTDHWWRTTMWSRGPFWTVEDEAVAAGKSDHRIPFILKLAGQREQLTYDQPFNTVLSRDLLLAVLRGEISEPQAVAAWLDQYRTIGDSPYNRDDLLP